MIVGVFWAVPASGGDSWPRVAAGAALAAAAFGAMVLRQRLPLAATAIAGFATIAGHVLGVCQDPMLATAWCLYPLAIERARRAGSVIAAMAGLLVVLALVTGVREGTGRGLGQHLIIAVGALGVAWMLGTATGNRIVAAQEAERMRVQLQVARDVHDVVGHSLGVILAQAGVVLSLPDADREELRDTLAEVESHARTALEEVQTLVRTLRAPSGARPGDAQAPGLERLPAVIAATRAAGVRVTARVEVRDEAGEAGALAFRIAQEALSNVVRHAPGAACTVHVYEEDDAVVVRVRNDGARVPAAGDAPTTAGGPSVGSAPAMGGTGAAGGVPAAADTAAAGRAPAGSGVGLRGMRERARLIGGTVSWGTAPDGGFEVTARLPVRGAS